MKHYHLYYLQDDKIVGESIGWCPFDLMSIYYSSKAFVREKWANEPFPKRELKACEKEECKPKRPKKE